MKRQSQRNYRPLRDCITNEQEAELAEHIKLIEARYYGWTSIDLPTLAFHLAKKIKLVTI